MMRFVYIADCFAARYFVERRSLLSDVSRIKRFRDAHYAHTSSFYVHYLMGFLCAMDCNILNTRAIVLSEDAAVRDNLVISHYR